MERDVLTHVLEELRRSDGAVRVRDRVLALAGPSEAVPVPHDDDGRAREELAREGYVTLEAVGTPELTLPLRRTVVALVDAGLPGVFAYLVDAMWVLADAVRHRVSARIGAPYELLDDGWAWSIPPGRGHGWPPHRGGDDTRIFDRQSPELVNVWVALGDVTADQACMFLVPLDEDPGYPHDLARRAAPLHAVRALPLDDGDALAWNANVLHWGGSSARARAPRVSCSFTLGRAGAIPPPFSGAPLDPTRTTADERLALIAGWIATYGEGQPDVAPSIIQWSRAHTHLFAARKER